MATINKNLKRPMINKNCNHIRCTNTNPFGMGWGSELNSLMGNLLQATSLAMVEF
jgi:hypothetical protein